MILNTVLTTSDILIFIGIGLVFLVAIFYLFKQRGLNVKKIIKDPDKLKDLINDALDVVDKVMDKIDEDSAAKQKYEESRQKLLDMKQKQEIDNKE